MALKTTLLLAALLILSISSPPPTAAQTAAPPSFSPAPAPAPAFVNLTNLLSVAGPFHTFLNYLVQTQVIQTFQNQANNTEQGITVFVPRDKAFSAIKKSVLANLTQDQLKSLLLLHALPKYYSLSEFKNLSSGPVSTFAGGQYALNMTDQSGTILIGSDWADTKISSSVFSTYPVAVYEVDKVLLPKAIFAADPPMAPAPAPVPDIAPAADAPSGSKTKEGAAPTASQSSSQDSSARFVGAGGVSYWVAAASACLMVMF